MEMPMACGCDEGIAGLVIADGAGRYFAIAWDDLQSHRVPAAWAAAVAALVRGEEPAGVGEDVCGHAAALAPGAGHALLVEVAGELRRTRPAAQRLEAWALLR
jgi:hypothetical protein